MEKIVMEIMALYGLLKDLLVSGADKSRSNEPILIFRLPSWPGDGLHVRLVISE